MIEAFFATLIFWVAFYVGYQCGENNGYDKGWQDKENGQPHKRPNK